MGRSLFLNVFQDKERRVWGVARICMADGSCLVVESRIYKENGVQDAPGRVDTPGRMDAPGYVSGEDDEDEPVRNKALDEALDKLATVVAKPGIKQAIPLPARMALALVIKARNAKKLEDSGDEAAAGALENLRASDNPITRRAVRALRLWK